MSVRVIFRRRIEKDWQILNRPTKQTNDGSPAKQRARIAGATQTNVLTKSRRRCCLCFWLDGIDEVVKGQLAHLDQESSNSKESNLAFLCLKHHDEYDSIPRQSKGYRRDEIKHWRDELYKEMAYRFRDITLDASRKQDDLKDIEEKMPDVLDALQSQLRDQPLARLVSLMHDNVTLGGDRLCLQLHYSMIPHLLDKSRILCNHNFFSHDEADFFWMSESFVKYVESRS